MKITVAILRDMEKQVSLGEISYSRMVEIINEYATSKSKEDNKLLLEEIEKLKAILNDPKNILVSHELFKAAESAVSRLAEAKKEIERISINAMSMSNNLNK